MHKPTFTTDWFTPHIETLEQHLAEFAGKPNITLLEIGSFEGRSALWFLEHILTHETAKLIFIDPAKLLPPRRLEQLYSDRPELCPQHNDDMAERITKNVLESPSGHKATWIRAHSQDALPDIPKESVDIAYIDGAHNAPQVQTDLTLTWPTVKPGGIVICDDYALKLKDIDGPGPAIDAFIEAHQDQIELLHQEYQCYFRKRF